MSAEQLPRTVRYVSKGSVDNLISATSRFHKDDNLHPQKYCCMPLPLSEYARLLNLCMVSYSENLPIQCNILTRSLPTGKLALAILRSACVHVRYDHQASTSTALVIQDEQRNTVFHPSKNGILTALEHRSSFSNSPRRKSDSGVQFWF